MRIGVGNQLTAQRKPGPSGPLPPVTANLILYADAQAITGLNNDDPMSSWDDLSGAGKCTLVQATAGKRPLYKTSGINGFPAVYFQNTDDGSCGPVQYKALKITGLDTLDDPKRLSLYFVIKLAQATDANECGFYFMANAGVSGVGITLRINHHPDGGSYDPERKEAISSFANDASQSASLDVNLAATNPTLLNPMVVGKRMTTENILAAAGRARLEVQPDNVSDLFEAGMSQDNDLKLTDDNFIGAYDDFEFNGIFDGYIASVVAYNSYLSDADHNLVMQYLMDRYAIS